MRLQSYLDGLSWRETPLFWQREPPGRSERGRMRNVGIAGAIVLPYVQLDALILSTKSFKGRGCYFQIGLADIIRVSAGLMSAITLCFSSCLRYCSLTLPSHPCLLVFLRR
jgi:hypothetical protein